MGAPWSELVYTILIGLGCLAIRVLNRVAGNRVAHLSFMLVTLGLFIPSWLAAGGLLSPVRFVSVIFFSLHIVLFPTFRLLYIISIWMFFTLTSLCLEYLNPDWVSGRPIETSISFYMIVEHAVVHFIVLITCGLLIRHTVNAFLRAESRLNQINQTQRDLLRVTSHDLRGPVNNLQLGIEALVTTIKRSSTDSSAQSDPTLQLVETLAPTLKLQVQHMDFLMRNLSYFRLNHSEKLTPFLESLSILELINHIIEAWRLQAKRAEITICLMANSEEASFVTDRMFFKQILDNLISNAIKYSPSSSEITITVTMSSNDVFIDVLDQGPGIDPTDQTRIFHCFERVGDPSRPREHSIGLGLWIVSLLAPLINAEVSLRQSTQEGSIFRLSLFEARV